MVRNWAVKHESEERVEAFWTLTHNQGADMKLMVPALVAVFAFGLSSSAFAEGSGPGGSEGGMGAAPKASLRAAKMALKSITLKTPEAGS